MLAWAKWIAVDEDGEWRWYVEEPVIDINFSVWVDGKSYGSIPKEYSPKNFEGNWENSLFSVEELREMKKLNK